MSNSPRRRQKDPDRRRRLLRHQHQAPRQRHRNGRCNSILIKLNQIGTVTETIETINMAKRAGYTPSYPTARAKPKIPSSPTSSSASKQARSRPAPCRAPTASRSTTSSCASRRNGGHRRVLGQKSILQRPRLIHAAGTSWPPLSGRPFLWVGERFSGQRASRAARLLHASPPPLPSLRSPRRVRGSGLLRYPHSASDKARQNPLDPLIPPSSALNCTHEVAKEVSAHPQTR